MTIYSRNAQVVGENTGITDKGIFNLFDAHQLVGLDSWGGNPEAFVVTALNETTVTLSGGTYKIFLGGGGGGGSSYSSEPGGLGGVFSFEANLAGGTYYAGVGAGGKYTSTSSTNGYRNSSSYACRGGNGSYGNSAGSGSGGGGSYLKSALTPSTAHWNNYLGIVGGGGAAATHGFPANFGAHGFGTGGPAWSSNWANTTVGGKNGFDGSGGTGGNPAYDPSTTSGLYGGDADQNGQLYGGPAGTSSGHNGGGGGGGAGGGAAGAGGGGKLDAGHGGYVSTTTTVGSYTASTIPRGGGGGGGHNNNCGACGGGGGVLLFSDYTNSWGTVEGTNIPYWGSDIGSSVIQHYTAWTELSGYSSQYFGTDLTATNGTLNGKCAKGLGTTAGGDGFVVIASLNQVVGSVTYYS